MTTRRAHIFRLLLIASYSAVPCAAQVSMQPQFGIVPAGSYASYKVDTVNMENGNDIIAIPLFSLPQLGKLSLGFSAVANGTFWQPEYVCSPDGTDCYYEYAAIPPTYDGPNPVGMGVGYVGIGPSIVADDFPYLDWTAYTSAPGCDANSNGTQTSPCYSTYWTVHDGTGGAHSLYYDSTNISQLRTTDGSGFLFLSGAPNPAGWSEFWEGTPTATPVLVDSRGVKISNLLSGGTETQSDPDGNTITAAPVSPGIQYTDSVNRVVPPITQATSSTAGCPILNYPNQPLASSAQWVVPGPNNTSATYLICYASISYHTNFFGDDGQSYTTWYYDNGENYSVTYQESFGTEVAIQSIVLPDGSYWAFEYDAANLNDTTSIAYATVTQLTFPEGGSISYAYGQAPVDNCSAGSYSPMVLTSRTISDAKGSNYTWIYNIGPVVGGSQSIVTDPSGNDTLYAYEAAPWYGNNVCGPVAEASRKLYQGSYTSGVLLRTIATNYSFVGEPLPGGSTAFQGFGNLLPSTVTTTLDNGASATTATNSYAGSIAAIMPSCGLFYHQDTSQWQCDPAPENVQGPPVTLTYSIPSSTTVADYSGSAIKTTTTQFQWQTTPGYLAANVLDTPSIVTTSDGSSNQVAQTTTSYDESSYVANAGAIAGHPTTVSRWNNIGAAVVTHTAWTQYGMVDHTQDGNGDTDAQYQWDFNADNSEFIHLFPGHVANAAGQATGFTWDVNTGKEASVTDPNLVVTQYSYDEMGRITQVLNAVGTPYEAQTKYQYPDPQTINVNRDEHSLNDGLLSWSASADGLGRVIETTDPAGAIQTTSYDWRGGVLAVSNPHYTSPSSTDGVTAYKYDALGRRLLQCDSDNGTSANSCAPGSSYKQWFYNGNVTTYWDEDRHTWAQTNDSLGRVTQIVEAGVLTTRYYYDALNNLLKVGQLGNGVTDTPRVRTFNYDSLSRLACAANPENANSTNPAPTCPATAGSAYVSGTVGYTYDANGNDLTRTDARGVVTHYNYDSLNRITAKFYSNDAASTLSSCFHYDAAVYGVGHLDMEWTQPGNCPGSPGNGYQTLRSFSTYDPMGRVLSETQYTPATIANGAYYPITYTYDLVGHLTSSATGAMPVGMTLSPGNAPCPSAPQFGSAVWGFVYCYDQAGRLQGVITNAGTALSTLFSNPAYAPFGGLANATYGNNAVGITRNFDPRLRITSETDMGNSPGTATNGSATITITGAEQSQ